MGGLTERGLSVEAGLNALTDDLTPVDQPVDEVVEPDPATDATTSADESETGEAEVSPDPVSPGPTETAVDVVASDRETRDEA